MFSSGAGGRVRAESKLLLFLDFELAQLPRKRVGGVADESRGLLLGLAFRCTGGVGGRTGAVIPAGTESDRFGALKTGKLHNAGRDHTNALRAGILSIAQIRLIRSPPFILDLDDGYVNILVSFFPALLKLKGEGLLRLYPPPPPVPVPSRLLLIRFVIEKHYFAYMNSGYSYSAL